MNRVFAYKRRVTWADCDPTGLWRFTSVMSFVEEAEVSMLREAGVLESLYGRLPRAYVEARFHAAASFDDEVTVLLSVTRMGKTSLQYHFEVRLRDELGATGELRAVLVSKQGRPQVIPAAVRRRLELWMSHAPPAREAAPGTAESLAYG